MAHSTNYINGFGAEEIFQLYAFVEAYETIGIKSYKTQTSLIRQYPELSDLLSVLKKVKCHYAKPAEMKTIDFKSLENEIYFTEYHIGRLLSLLYHIRNSVAHAYIIKYGDSALITDHKVQRPVDFSARGKVSLSVINEFTEILKKAKL